MRVAGSGEEVPHRRLQRIALGDTASIEAAARGRPLDASKTIRNREIRGPVRLANSLHNKGTRDGETEHPPRGDKNEQFPKRHAFPGKETGA